MFHDLVEINDTESGNLRDLGGVF